jgi:putative membrane protein
MLIHWLVHLLISALIILAVSKLVPGVKLRSFGTAIVVALVLGVLGVVLGWALTLVFSIVALPAILLTFGLALILVRLIVNMILLWLTDKLIEGFEIDGMGTLLIASLVISVLQHVAFRFLHL